ncbi:MAG: PadR family transcriptional regulator, partial [Methanobrevibacter sp.]|nr:PadR family transcriptional regulator [Methanobrevibacter sp.]
SILIDEGSLKKSNPSNIYPILNKMEDLGLITSEFKIKNNKQLKYFKITDDGVHVLDYLWSRFDIIHNNSQWKLLFEDMG